jgi:hypothetical protein
MPQACWQAAADGTYWMDVALGGRELLMLIDTGFLDALNRIGFSLEPGLYTQIRQAGEFVNLLRDFRLDASGQITVRENGLIRAQMVCPLTRQRIGPAVQLYASRGSLGSPTVSVSLSFSICKAAESPGTWVSEHGAWNIRDEPIAWDGFQATAGTGGIP